MVLKITIFRNGAKIDRNPQGTMNINPKVLEEYLFEDCMLVKYYYKESCMHFISKKGLRLFN